MLSFLKRKLAVHQEEKEQNLEEANSGNLHERLRFSIKLGEGSYSKVKKAFSTRHNREVAVKIVNKNAAPHDFQSKFLPRELAIVKLLSHENIVKYYDIFDRNNKIYILMDYIEGGDLLDYIQKNGCVSEYTSRMVFKKMVSAVRYLHTRGIVHRDLKCENVLLDEKMNPKLTDFGFAKRINQRTDLSMTFCGSAAYAPLEILLGRPYSGFASDVWSLGIILYIMLTGLMPFDDSSPTKLIKAIEQGPRFHKKVKQKLSEKAKSIIIRILQSKPVCRPPIIQIERDPWF